jgi:putative ABC transport system permease protein
MTRLGRAGRQLTSFFWRASTRDEVDADIAFHLDMVTQELERQGMSVEQARAEAVRRFGDVNAITLKSHRLADERDARARRAEHRGELRQDLAFALRVLRRSPAFSVMAILTLALGFGATGAVFSALDAVVLKPLPFPDADHVVTVRATRRGEVVGGTAAEFFALQDRSRGAFQHIAAAVETGFTVRAGDTPELIAGMRVSADYFRVLGVAAALGRIFAADEDVPGHDAVVVLSHRAWFNRHAADSGILGKPILVDGAPRTVIGVMPSALDLLDGYEEIWVPLALTRDEATRRGARFLDLRARLRDGVSLEQASSSAVAALRFAAESDPSRAAEMNQLGALIRPVLDDFVGDYRGLLRILLGAGAFVLLIACTNVANLLIARGSVRGRELSIRAALGAGRGRLVRQLVTESGVIAAAGATVGLALAFTLLRAVLAVSPEGVPRLDTARVDLRVLGFTALCAAVSTLLFGILPAVRLSGVNLETALRAGGRTVKGGRDRVRAALVAVEVALAMTLLVGAGLLIRSALLIQTVAPGFDARGVYTARVMLPAGQYADSSEIVRFYERLHRAAAEHPSIGSASLVSIVPLSGSNASVGVTKEGQGPEETALLANLRIATQGYFGTMRIPLRAGRDLTEQDVASAPRVVVINEAMAARLWPGAAIRDILGRRLNALASQKEVPTWWTVAGVVGNVRSETLSDAGRPEMFIPLAQAPALLWPYLQRSLVLVARTRRDAIAGATLERPVRELVTSIDANLAIADGRAMTDFLRSSRATARFNTMVLGTLGGIALLLAAIGVYGVVSYFVSQRTQDIAVRMALGATPAEIWSYVAMRGMVPLLFGVAFGVLLSLTTGRLLRAQLYGVTVTDPLTVGGTALLLLAVSALATFVPARRAMRVAPLTALGA